MPFKTALKLIAVFIVVLYVGSVVLAQEIPYGDPFRGGQLYDNWFVVLDIMPPQGDQPLWQTQNTNRRFGTVTWRCSICHGWDYKGAEGAFGLGSAEYTGFPGINDIVGASTKEIAAWLDGTNNPDHDFSELINRRGLVDLITFMRTKLVDTSLLIDSNNYSSLGLENAGREQYNQTCARCHGMEGNTLDFNSDKEPEFIGDVALSNPWKFVHKIRFGSPLVESHAFEQKEWTLQNISDTLAYSQTLPPADPNAGVLNSLDQELDSAGQGDMNAIVIAAAGIAAAILLGLGWTSFRGRS